MYFFLSGTPIGRSNNIYPKWALCNRHFVIPCVTFLQWLKNFTDIHTAWMWHSDFYTCRKTKGSMKVRDESLSMDYKHCPSSSQKVRNRY